MRMSENEIEEKVVASNWSAGKRCRDAEEEEEEEEEERKDAELTHKTGE